MDSKLRNNIYICKHLCLYFMNWWKCDLLLKLVKTAFICIKCNNLRATLGNSVDVEGLSCQTLFHSLFGKNEEGHFKTSKEKAASQLGKNQFFCVQILCCELLFVDMEALPCNFLMQQMKWISCFMLILQIVLEGQTHLISDLSDHHNKCKESGMWQQLVWECQPVIMSQVLYMTFTGFYILNLWMCQAD